MQRGNRSRNHDRDHSLIIAAKTRRIQEKEPRRHGEHGAGKGDGWHNPNEKEREAMEAGLLEKELTEEIIGAAIEVHKALGPGLLESAYAACLRRELELRRIPFEAERPLPVEYKGKQVDCGYRLDLLVDRRVVVELKAVEELDPVHEAQLLTYLRLTGARVGLLINFNVPLLTDGVRRRVL
jgi:GxxExxY protein